jgi:cadmium resistance protein CadD (predicted permease)
MEIFLTSVIAFVSTNLDDIFILALFFGGQWRRQYRDLPLFATLTLTEKLIMITIFLIMVLCWLLRDI